MIGHEHEAREIVQRPCLRLVGDYDVSRKDELAEQLSILVQTPSPVIDLSEVFYIDSSAISCFFVLRKRRLETLGTSEIAFVGVNPQVRRILEICNLAEYIDEERASL